MIKKRKSFKESHFKRWKQRINNYVINEIGIHIDDLPDLPYRFFFEKSYLKPKDISYIVLENFYQIDNFNRYTIIYNNY